VDEIMRILISECLSTMGVTAYTIVIMDHRMVVEYEGQTKETDMILKELVEMVIDKIKRGDMFPYADKN